MVYAETGASFSNTANDTDGLFDHDQEYNIFDGNENEDSGAMQKEPRITPRSATWEKKLYKDNMWTGGTPNPDTELKDGESVSISDQFIVQYNFILSPEAIENIDSNNNKEYSLSCPDGLEWKTGEDTDIAFESGDEKIKFATLVRKEGKASLIFTDNLKDKAESGIEGIYLYLGCGLNEAMLEEQGQPEEVVIELTDSAIVHVKIVENQPRNSALDEKTGSYNNGLFKWTVRYQPGNKEQNLPLTLVDEFDSLYHDYKEGSICIRKTDGSEYKPDPATLDVLRENGRTLIKCVIPEDISNGTDPVTITYETVLTDAGLTAAKNQTVTNSAWLVNSKNMPVGNKITGKVTFQKTEWLKKDSAGSLQYDTDGRYLEWTVTVLTNGKNLDKLILHDKLLSGTDYTSIDEKSVTVTAYRGGSKADETNDHTIQMHENNVGYDLTFNKRDADKYEIKYKTYINEKYFQSSVSGQFKNQASLEYGWYPNGGDTGEMFEPDSPVVTKPVNVNGNLIGKSGEGYNPANSQITWRVTVNPYKLDLSKITTTDNLKDVGQTYVDRSFAVDGGNGSVTPDWNVDTGVLTAEFKDTGKTSFSYTFKTIVNEEKDYGYNLARKDYKNTVSANAVLKDGTSNELKSTATAAQNIWSNVLQKEAEGYDYRDHTIP